MRRDDEERRFVTRGIGKALVNAGIRRESE